jgi:hypothetical protein
MTTQLDASIGVKKETTFGTGVTVDQFVEFLDSSKFTYKPAYTQGEGLRVGSRVQRSARNGLSQVNVGATVDLEAPIKGLGLFLEAALGSVTSTAVPSASGAYQHVATLATTDPLPSYTMQYGTPPIGGGTTLAQTFLGMQCNTFELTAKSGEIAQISTEWVGKDMTTATAYATPSYPSNQDLFLFTQGAIALGTGAITAATTTALASGGTSVANILEVSVKIENGLDDVKPSLGSAGKRHRRGALGAAKISGKVVAEFDAATYRDAHINRTNLGMLLTFTHTSSIGTGTPVNPVLQVVIPVLKIEAELPSMSSGIFTQSIDFEGFSDLSAQPIQVVYRSTDATV